MYIPYGRQTIEEDDILAVEEVLRSDFLTTGPKINEFERAVADYVGAKYAIAVANGTAALHAACFAADIGMMHSNEADSEVITSPITFAASSNSVLYCTRGGGGSSGGRCRPVFADIDPKTYNISPEEIEKKITPKTKAILPVHFTGQPCEMDEIHAIAKKHHLLVIEDAAHALGADYKGKKIGSISDMTTFSFHPVKHITCGEGGMIVTNKKELYDRLCLFRAHGITRDTSLMTKNEGDWYYEQLELGYNYRITDIQCALGLSQLKKLNRFIARRKELVNRYDEAFRYVEEITVPYMKEGCNSSWHLYIIKVERRKEIFDRLRQAGIVVNVHYIPVYKHPYYQNHGYKNVCCPNAEQYYQHCISLPLYAGLTNKEQDYVIEEVKKAL